jgi:hypothetical protein
MVGSKDARKRHSPHYFLIAFIGIVLIFGSIYFRGETSNVFWDTIIDVGKALIIGPTISWLLDLPSMINYFKKITIKSLVSEEYLNTLPREKLLDLRKKCTARIHLKNTKFVEQGLIDLDESVCELLTKHYHERYRQNVTCKIEGDYVIKKHHIEEFIVNPLHSHGSTIKIPDGMTNFLYKRPEENVNDLFKISKYSVFADEKDEVDFVKAGMQLKVAISDATDMPYNTIISITDKDNNPINLEFSKWLKIEKIYEIKVPKEDRTFLKRVKIPVKSFRLDYHFPDSHVKLVASCFGTLAFSTEGSMKIIHEIDHISIESYSWLLPGNGVFVVAI